MRGLLVIGLAILHVTTVHATLSILSDTQHVLYTTANAFSTPNSFDTSHFTALVVPVQFDGTRSCQLNNTPPSIPTTLRYDKVLFLIDWPKGAKPAGCRSYESVIAALAAVAVPSIVADADSVYPLFYGYAPHLYDVAGPYVYVGNVAQALAVYPDGAARLLDMIAGTKAYPVVSVDLEPGEWNVFVEGIGFIATRTIYLCILALMDILTVYRMYKLVRALVNRRRTMRGADSVVSRWTPLKLAWNDPFFKMYIVQLFIITTNLPTPNERSRSAIYQVFAAFAWSLVQATVVAFYVAWASLTFRIRPLTRYKFFSLGAKLTLGVGVLGFALLVVGATVPPMLRLYDVGVLVAFAGTTVLLLVLQICHSLFAIGFHNYLKRHRISPNITVHFKKTIWIGGVFLISLLMRLVGSIFYLTASTPMHYLTMLMVTRCSAILVQICTLWVPNTADVGWSAREDEQVRGHKSPPLPGHLTILDWLKTTILEQQVTNEIMLLSDVDSQDAVTPMESAELHA